MSKTEKDSKKEYSFKGKKISFVTATVLLAKAKGEWKWLDPALTEFIDSADNFRDIVVPENMSEKERTDLRAGIRGRLNSKDFTGKAVMLVSVTDSVSKKLKMQLQKIK
jgi:hypothetical protein